MLTGLSASGKGPSGKDPTGVAPAAPLVSLELRLTPPACSATQYPMYSIMSAAHDIRSGRCSFGPGFTLIEILVVLAIVAFVAVVVPPRLSGAIEGARLKGAARELAAELRRSRTLAVERGRESVLTLDTSRRRYVPPGRLERSLPEAIDVRLVTARSERVSERVGGIRFFPDGSSTGGHVTLRSGAGEYRVDVHWLTGRVRVEP